jgi:hypothetical protein
MPLLAGMWCVGFLFVMHCEPADQQAVASGATFCQVAKPFYWSAKDTRSTKEQADTWNRKGKALCGWEKQSSK